MSISPGLLMGGLIYKQASKQNYLMKTAEHLLPHFFRCPFLLVSHLFILSSSPGA